MRLLIAFFSRSMRPAVEGTLASFKGDLVGVSDLLLKEAVLLSINKQFYLRQQKEQLMIALLWAVSSCHVVPREFYDLLKISPTATTLPPPPTQSSKQVAYKALSTARVRYDAYGPKYSNHPFPQQHNQTVLLYVSKAVFERGGNITVEGVLNRACEKCGGTGALSSKHSVVCRVCSGRLTVEGEVCPKCLGNGNGFTTACQACKGKRLELKKQSVTLTMPPKTKAPWRQTVPNFCNEGARVLQRCNVEFVIDLEQ